MSMQLARPRIYLLSRLVIVAIVVAAIGTLFIQPTSALGYAADIIFRTWLMFLCTVMAHDASHGHLGRTKAANLWWGRIALIPATVPYLNFRKTHYLHHKHTNVPDEDPDHFIKPNHWWEVPLRSIALPHYWLLWLAKRGRIKQADVIELLFTYATLTVVFATVLWAMGPWRLFMGMVPSLLLVSIFLWYSFAVKTHEGFTTGDQAARSHNYYGKAVYWLTLGLSMHREHHLYPKLSWIELLPYVEQAPGPWYRRFMFTRDIRHEA